jgi:multidrug transporter EmrE-like cation transporter
MVMASWLNRRRGRNGCREDEGSILVMVLAISFLLVGLVTVSLAVTRSSASTAYSYQAGTSARLVAESGIAAVFDQMENTSAAVSLPCSVAGTVGSIDESYDVTVSYEAGSTALPCSGGTPVGSELGTSAMPTEATLTSVGTSPGGGAVAMEERVQLVQTTPLAPAYDYAIMTPGTMPLSVDASVYKSASGQPANLYSGQTFQCTNAVLDQGSVLTATTPLALSSGCDITGSLTAQGDISVTNSAVIGGTATAIGGSIDMSSGGQILGNAYATGGNIDLNNNPVTIGGNAYATGGILEPGKATIGGAQYPNDASIATMTMPPAPVFPTLDPTVSQWQAKGYTVIPVPGTDPLTGKTTSCSTYFVDQYVYVQGYGEEHLPSPFVEDVDHATGPIVVDAPTCNADNIGSNLVEPGGTVAGSTFNMSADVAVVVDTFQDYGSMVWQPSTGAGTQDLSIIALSTSSTAIDLTNQTDFTAGVDTLLYTPGTVDFSVEGTMTGQVLAGTSFSATNAFSMTYSTAAASSLPGTTVTAPPTLTPTSEFLLRD